LATDAFSSGGATAEGAVATERDDYIPRFYIVARDPDSNIDLTALRSVYDHHPDAVATEMVTRRPGFRRNEESIVAVSVNHINRVILLARQARQINAYPVGALACFNSTSRGIFGTVSGKVSIRRRRVIFRRSGSASRCPKGAVYLFRVVRR